MSKHDAKKNLEALRALNDEMALSTITDKAIHAWADRLDAVVAGCRDYTSLWMKSLPAKGSKRLETFEIALAAMAGEIQNVYSEAYVAASTPADFLKLDLSVWAEPLDRAGKAVLDLLQLPLALRTSRLMPTRAERPSEYSPVVRQAIIDAAARKPSEKKPDEGKQ